MANTFNHNGKVVITDGGNVGIGTTGPTSILDASLSSGGTSGFRFKGWSDASTPYLLSLGTQTYQDIFQIKSVNGLVTMGVVGAVGAAPDLVLQTNTTERMRITSAGNVGIGVTSPSYKLDVFGGFNAVTSGVNITYDNGILYHGNYYQITSGNNYLLYARGGGALLLGSDDVERIRITSGGNVGIGTTNPGAKLEVNGGSILIRSTSNQTINLYNNGTVAANIGGTLQFSGTYRNSDFDSVVYASIFGGKENATNGNYAGYMSFSTYTYAGSFSERMRITSTGNVGIGTTSPTQILSISRVSTDNYIKVEAGGQAANYSGLMLTEYGINWGWALRHNAATDLLHISYQDNTPTFSDVVTFDRNGNVGIGTTSPGDKLDILGSGAQFLKISNVGTYLMRFGIDASNNGYIGSSNATPIGFHTNSVNRLFITTDGNVGIGTTSPVSHAPSRRTLVVADTVNGANVEIWGDSSGKSILQSVSGNTYVGNLASGSGTGATYITSGNGSTYTTFLANGNVGIGTTSPGHKLSVFGGDAIFTQYTGTGNGSSLTIVNSTTTSDGTALQASYFGSGGYGPLKFEVGGSERMRITSAGNVGIGTTAPANTLQIGSVGTTGYGGNKFAIGDGTNVVALHTAAVSYLTANGDIVVGAGGNTTNQLYVKSGGNVGIGTTSPSFKLDVAGAGGDWAARFYSNASASAYFAHGGGYGGYIDAGSNASSSTYLLSLVSNGSTRVYVRGDGNVGIGATSPGSKLHVYSGSSGGTPYAEGITAESNSRVALNLLSGAANDSYVFFGNSSSGNAGYIGYDNTANRLILRSSDYVSLLDSTGEVVRIDGGNVGIGTTSPSEKLHVDGNVIVTYNNSFQGINSIGNKAILARVSPTTGIINYAEYATATNLNGFVLGSDDARVKGDIATDSLDFVTNTSSRMFINSSGNVGIATTSPSYKLDVVGDSRITSGSLGVGVAPNATDGRIDASNDIVAYSTSDQRLKENVTPIENALEKVKTLTGVEFDWKEETAHVHGYHGHDVGIIAQDVQAVLPEAVRTNESGYLSVRYEKMIALLIEANKELAARVEFLEQKLKQ